MEIGRIIKALRDARGWKQADLAKRLGVAQHYVSRWEGGVEPRGAARDRILELAEESGLLGERRRENVLAIMGHVGAGAVIDAKFEQLPPEGIEQIELPYPVDENLVGFEVRGDSMRPKYDPGEILVVEREQPTHVDNMLGDIAVILTYDDRRLVKRIMPGPRPRTYNLESVNAETEIGVRIRWASPVRMVIPNVGLRRLGKNLALKKRRATMERGAAARRR